MAQYGAAGYDEVIRDRADLAASLVRAFAAERVRWPLWLPAGLAVGVGGYFALPTEPSFEVGLAIAFAAGLGALLAWRSARAGREPVLLVLLALVAVASGFVSAQMRSAQLAAPVLEQRWGPGQVRGRIRSVEALPAGKRIVLDRLTLAGLAPEDTPVRVRVRLAGKLAAVPLVPGDAVLVRAILLSPPAPHVPGGFDFQRYAWFQQLGGVGYAIGRPEVLGRDETASAALAVRIAALRQAIADRIRAAIGGPTGAVAAALLTGDRRAIPEDVLAAMRDSGLAHLLAISGLHIGLVAGLIFLVFRAALALVPRLALHFPIKKWAAVVAVLGAVGYLVISGATVPTQRAVLMIGLAFLAVLFDRSAISMRVVALAATAILLLAPESLMTASFQMSFAAVVALVAAYETLGERISRWRRGRMAGWWRRPAVYFLSIALTSVVAGAATGFFAVYHFNRLALFGLAANMVAVPIVALWVMPWGVLAFALMPFGLEGLALAPMGWGIDGVLRIARGVADMPGAVMLAPAVPVIGLLSATIGGLWLCLWQRRWRYGGLIGVALGVASIPFARSPDILVSGDATLVAVRGASGAYMLSTRRKNRFAADGWLRQAGQDKAERWPWESADKDQRLHCDAAGCIYRAGGYMVALVRDERALAEDCWLADLVVSLEPVRVACPQARTVIDRFDLWRGGAHAIWLDSPEVRIESVNGVRGNRPWALRPSRRVTVKPSN